MNLYTYDAKNSLYNNVWNFQLPAITQRTILFLIVNLKYILSSNPTRSRLWAFDCSRSYKPLDLRKRMSCTAQSHLNHHGFLNDFRLTSACTLLAKNLPLRKYFAQNIMRYVISIKTTANSIHMDLWVVIKHWRRQGGPRAQAPQWPGKIFFVKIEGLSTIKLNPGLPPAKSGRACYDNPKGRGYFYPMSNMYTYLAYWIEIRKFCSKNLVHKGVNFEAQNAKCSKSHLRAPLISNKFPGVIPPDPH